MTGPVKAGLRLGGSGFLVLPSPDRFDPSNGVNGKPLSSVAIPFTCQPPISFSEKPVRCLPKGNSYVRDMLDWLVTFRAAGPQSSGRLFRFKIICGWFWAWAMVSPEFISKFFDHV